MNLFFYLTYYFLISFSIIGFGYLFKNLFIRGEKNNLGYLGIYGIFSLIFISYLSNYFISHNLLFNSILWLTGLVIFISFLKKNYSTEKKQFKFISIIFLFLSVAIFAAKNHDDFPYYHFAYIHLLTESNLLIGLGQFNHGFKTPSSIFYFASFLYLPKVNYQLIHLAPIFFVSFVNYIFLEKIFKLLKKKKELYLVIYSILSLAIINIFFYRLAEHGTDRTAQILIFLLIFEIFQLINFKTNERKVNLSNILIICTIIISLKVFYFIYLLIFFVIIIYQKSLLIFFQNILKNKITYICLVLISFIILTNIFNSGCLIYPLPASCIFNFTWSLPIEEVEYLNQWYQQWSKAGATPHFRVENPEIYIKNLNWLPNWIDFYFFNKVSDYLAGLIFLVILFFFFFQKNFNAQISKRKFWSIYLILLILFFEWFLFHPALRYGGYHLIALLIFIPFSIYYENLFVINDKNIKRLKAFIILIFFIFFMRNVDRIYKEHKIYNYNFLKYPSYNLEFENFAISSRIINIKNCLKGLECNEDNIKVEKKYIFNIFTRK